MTTTLLPLLLLLLLPGGHVYIAISFLGRASVGEVKPVYLQRLSPTKDSFSAAERL